MEMIIRMFDLSSIFYVREKVGSGWVGQAPTRIFVCVCFQCFFVFFCRYLKKWVGGGMVGVEFGQSNFFSNSTIPLYATGVVFRFMRV